MFENFDWNLLLTALGVIFACGWFIVGIYQAYYKVYLPRKNERLLKKKKELQQEVHNFAVVISQLESCIKRFVETNEFPDTPDVGYWGLPQEFISKIEKFCEMYKLCVDLFHACIYTIQVTIANETKRFFPKTVEKIPDLNSKFEDKNFVKMYLDGKEVTRSWIEEKEIGTYKFIVKNLQEPEIELNEFFQSVNMKFKDNRVMERFRKLKRELVESGNQTIENLKLEKGLLEKQLLKNKDLSERGNIYG